MKDWKGKPIKCPKCGSEDIKPATSDIGNPFDYVKDCKSCGHQFSAEPHN